LLTNEVRKFSTTVESMVLKTVTRASVLKFPSASVKVVMSTLSIKLTKSELGISSRATAKASISVAKPEKAATFAVSRM